MNDIGTKILGAIDRAITGTKPQPKDPRERAALVVVEIAAPKVKSALGARYAEAKKLWADVSRLNRHLNFELTETEAIRVHEKQLAEHEKLATDGGDLNAVARGRSRDGWIQDYESRRLAAQQSLAKIAAKFRPLQTEIGDLLLVTLRDEIAELENVEARQAARFNLPYAASPTVNTLRSLADYLRNRGAVLLLENSN